MKQYHIHHHKNEWKSTYTGKEEKEYVGIIEAKSLEDAFKLSQNDFGKHPTGWNIIKTRSTSVGDVIQEDNDFYLIMPVGFKLLNQ